MIGRIWSGESPLWRVLLPLSLLYGAASGTIRLSYHTGLCKSWRAPLPVVVVGNLTAGGSGKTPLLIWLAEQLRGHGVKVGVVSRGYGGKAPHYPLLVSSHSLAAECGDEPLLIFQRTGVPIAVAPQRVAAVKFLTDRYPLDVILTDDGLQHYALQRDMEIVVIDGVRRFGNGWWLPAGPMRERAGRLRTVSAIVTNGGQPKPGEIPMQLNAGAAINLASGAQCPLSALSHVVALAGIGHPARFFSTLTQAGLQPENCIPLADHRALSQQELQQCATPSQNLLMTEKDAVKYRPFAANNWWYLPVSAQLPQAAGERLINAILSLLTSR